jgi:hypothetical protein
MSYAGILEEAESRLNSIPIRYNGANKSSESSSLVAFFQQSPLYGVSLDLERIPDTGRDIILE